MNAYQIWFVGDTQPTPTILVHADHFDVVDGVYVFFDSSDNVIMTLDTEFHEIMSPRI